jgi:UDP-N-acetylmuramoyl-tripeptide--D-alanyl-D-alanine ligase
MGNMRNFLEITVSYTTVELYVLAVLGVLTVVLLNLLSYKVIQALQLSQYRLREFGAWWKAGGKTHLYRHFFLGFLSALGMAIFVASFGDRQGYRLIGYAFFAVLSTVYLHLNRHKGNTPLRGTPRIIRLYCTLSALYALIVVGLIVLPSWILLYAQLGLVPLAIVPIVLCANFVNSPLERVIQRKYIRAAKAKLAAHKHLVVIGITGSFGKTSAKNILHSMLAMR